MTDHPHDPVSGRDADPVSGRDPDPVSGRDSQAGAPAPGAFEAARSAEIVGAALAGTADPRLREVLTSLVRHAHAFVKDVALTTDEWAAGIDFLTRTGQKCDATRQEFVLLSDVLGVSMLVDTLANPADRTYTESTVEGPFPGLRRRLRRQGEPRAALRPGGRPGPGRPVRPAPPLPPRRLPRHRPAR
ncbi:dioxygenase [Streptomyces ziwulingensis]|uniref:Catechol dioxygenase N-terminal domain-containing protein n=1 Tax=Streptomyces ziwulingensis TaxID=1045501 RepID=A0ABP9CGU8_9ACTN